MSKLPAKVFEEAFDGQQITFYQDSDGEIFARADEVGLCMTNAKNLRDAGKRIREILLRNPSDFEGFASDRKLRSLDGKARNVKVLKGRGIFMVAFFARTDKAIRFRRWAAQIVNDLALGNKRLIDEAEYQRLVSSNHRNFEIANNCLNSLEVLVSSTQRIASLAGALLRERKKQLVEEEAMRKELSDFPLFEDEGISVSDPPGIENQ